MIRSWVFHQSRVESAGTPRERLLRAFHWLDAALKDRGEDDQAATAAERAADVLARTAMSLDTRGGRDE